MEKCPTCKADLKGQARCRRCRTDLSQVLDTASQAESYRLSAGKAYQAGLYEQMLRDAGRSFSLRRTLHSCRLSACAAMLCGDYGLAVKLWKLRSRDRRTRGLGDEGPQVL